MMLTLIAVLLAFIVGVLYGYELRGIVNGTQTHHRR